MSEEKYLCLGCKGVLNTDWPSETNGTKGEGVYWYRCPKCNGRNILKEEGAKKLVFVEFIADIK